MQAKDIWEGNLGLGTNLLITHVVEQMITFYNCGVKHSISVITTIKFDFNILKCPSVTKISSNIYEPCLCFDISCLNINICYSSGYNDSVTAFYQVSFYLYVCNMFTLHDQWKSTLICLYTSLVLHITTRPNCIYCINVLVYLSEPLIVMHPSIVLSYDPISTDDSYKANVKERWISGYLTYLKT